MAKEPQNQQKQPKPKALKSFAEAAKALGISPAQASQQPIAVMSRHAPAATGSSQEQARPRPPKRESGDARQEPPMRIPLRKEIVDAVQVHWNQCHPGLAYDKFPNTWEPLYKDPKAKTVPISSFHAEGPQKKAFFEKIVRLVAGHQHGPGANLFSAFLARRCRFFESLRQESWLVSTVPLSTDWRLVSGLGIAHPFETGFVFDHTYGVPYLPGSSVKGAARAWAEDTGWDYPTCEVVFGPEQHPPKGQSDIKKFVPAQGHVVFFDAYPTMWPELEVDILNPHYKAYYEGKSDSDGNSIPPADYLSPEPTYFLTVKANTTWEFVVGVSPKSEEILTAMAKVGIAGRQKLLALAEQAVRGAATEFGLGGKTSVGYGYFR